MPMISASRRALLLGAASATLTGILGTGARAASAEDRFAALEVPAGLRLGLAALNTADGARMEHRANERFAFCSTFKVLAASAILQRSTAEADLLQRRISYGRDELAPYSPVTSKHADEGMTVAELCAAALQYSDNTAANLMIRLLGGPAAVTAFARSIGDDAFRLDRWETALNTAVPDDPRDTTTPAAMLQDLQQLTLGDALGRDQRAQLVLWLRGNTTGAKRMRAGVPASWSVADKTGTGDHGTTNDIGLLWPPGKPPILLAIYVTQATKTAAARDDVVAAAARIVADALG